MAIERTDVDEARDRARQSKERTDRLATFEAIQNRARPYEQLINDPHWNPFVNDLTQWRDEARTRANVLAGQLTDPGKFLTADQVVALRMNIAALRAEADAYEKAMAIPRHRVEEKEKLEEVMQREVTSHHA